MKDNYKNRIYALFILLIFIAGCATWTKAGGPYVNNALKYSADLPWGWMKYKGQDLLLTRDGLFLEEITVRRVNINKKLEHTKKKFVKGMLPEELAEVEIDNISSNPSLNNFELMENVPISLSVQNAFRLSYSFSNKDGLKYKCIHYGFAYENWVYSLVYTSTADYYFEKNLEAFNQVTNSFKFLAE